MTTRAEARRGLKKAPPYGTLDEQNKFYAQLSAGRVAAARRQKADRMALAEKRAQEQRK